MTAFEDFVTEQVLKGRSIIGLYPALALFARFAGNNRITDLISTLT